MKKNCRSVVVLPQPRANFEINPTTWTRLFPGDGLWDSLTSAWVWERGSDPRYDVVYCEASEDSLLSLNLKADIKRDDIVKCFGSPQSGDGGFQRR